MVGARRSDASEGEFDARSGLTRVTRQRGRLLFHMGASGAAQRAACAAPGAAAGAAPGAAPGAASERSSAAAPPSGLALYPEEALFLVRRGAMAVFPAGDSAPGDPLDAAALEARLVRHHHVSLACIEVYAFLKAAQLHPRRPPGAGEPRHARAGDAEPPAVAFDVFKRVAAAPGGAGKRLALVFRVLVCRWEDAPPAPSALRAALVRSQAERPGAALKLAVVARGGGVLLLELGPRAASGRSPADAT